MLAGRLPFHLAAMFDFGLGFDERDLYGVVEFGGFLRSVKFLLTGSGLPPGH